MSNLRTSNQTKLEDYPPGVQCLLKDAAWHLEQLTILGREYQAWQAAQDETEAAGIYIVNSQGQYVGLFALHGPVPPVGIGKLVTLPD